MAIESNTQGTFWKRLSLGRPVATVGFVPSDPPVELGLSVARVRCDVPRTTLGPLSDARFRIEHLLGEGTPLFDQARDRVVSGLRRRLLGEEPLQAEGTELVELANRLAAEVEGRAVLVFEAVEAADAATLEVLRSLVVRRGWLKLTLVLAFRSEPTGAALSLLDALLATEGPVAVIRPEVAPAPKTEPTTRNAPFPIRSLPSDVLRVLRAGAIIGTGFEVGLVAALLGVDELDVLDLLQRAADLGVPLEDAGEDRFHLPEALIAELTGSTLPSLANAWHRMLASMLETEAEEQAEAEKDLEPAAATEPVPAPAAAAAADTAVAAAADTAPAAAAAADTAPAPAPAPAAVSAAASDFDTAPASAPPYADLFGQTNSSDEPAAEPAADDAVDADVEEDFGPQDAVPPVGSWVTAPEPLFSRPADKPDRREAQPARVEPERVEKGEASRAAPPPTRADDARAAGHLAAAGDIEASIEKYRAAAEKAASVGAFAQALAHGSRALALVDALPQARERKRMRARQLMELGRLQWQAPGQDPAFTLRRALDSLEQARASLASDETSELRTQIATLIASVCYDLGDMRSLERAEAELAKESRALLDAGDAVGAARLLNDQAAVYVRMGDPVRAVHLLTESRHVFEARAPNDPVAQVELAETDHLLARIPLHVPPRPGREMDALDMGLDHALAAARTYERLGAARELGRVWETMGRLDLKKGRVDRAAKRLSASLELGQKIGDVVGLARSAAAMSEVLAASGRYREAIALLGDSITLNLEKGSLIGLALNRRAFDELGRRAPKDGATQAVLRTVAERLNAAEAVLPRITIPGT